jgi:hypothetical protein
MSGVALRGRDLRAITICATVINQKIQQKLDIILLESLSKTVQQDLLRLD